MTRKTHTRGADRYPYGEFQHLTWSEKSRWHRYKVSPTVFAAMLARQGGHCATCDKTQYGTKGRALAIDHDHETGKIRGLLCGGCNAFLGQYERPGYVESVQGYLNNPPGRPEPDCLTFDVEPGLDEAS